MQSRACVGLFWACLFILAALVSQPVSAQGALPLAGWKGSAGAVEGLKGEYKYTQGYPEKQRTKLTYTSEKELPAGVYQLRLKLRPSHVSDDVAWHSGVKVLVNEEEAADLQGLYFTRANQPEWKTVQVVHSRGGFLTLTLAAYAETEAFKRSTFKAARAADDGPDADPDFAMDDFAVGLTPREHQYLLLEGAELALQSRGGLVEKVETDKINYKPGETLHGTATLRDVSGAGGAGTVTLYLEHDVQTREKVKEIPVTLTKAPQTLKFDIPLPQRELGYELVAVYTSADGKERAEAFEVFTIARNFYRVAIHGGGVRFGNTLLSRERQRELFAQMKANYQNCGEMFAWAEEDMVEMSSETDWWFSGQTCYHLKKDGLKSLIEEAHKQGISCVTYGKFIMSGYLGWKTAYDYPNDHKSQYNYPVGMWEGVNTVSMDRFYNKEFYPIGFGPNLREGVFQKMGWQDFLPINPDNTPRMVRIAAEEIIRTIEMFGWDAVRWDGHPRGGGQCGGEGKYDYHAARKTQSLVRYFKDIVNAKHPDFQHGYNYYFVQGKPDPSWAYEDFELDELCRDGGLVMNESIRNSAGRPFEWIANNIQVEGDLSRERGGLFLGISCDGESARDELVEGILYYAGGCRPYSAVGNNRLLNRYALRYSKYTFNEHLRRLAQPEGVLKPIAETKLWWQPFVYETPVENGSRQLVVNLLNIPRQGTPKTELSPKIEWDMPAGTDPVTMALTLPAGYTAKGASLIDPFTLEVTPVPVTNGRLDLPAVDMWLVLVVDMAVAPNATPLNDLYGAPKTFNVKRPNLDINRIDPLTLDISKSVVEVNKDMSYLAPKKAGAEEKIDPDTLAPAARQAKLQETRDAQKPENLINTWWKGGSLPQDIKLKEKAFDFGDLAPQRNGRMDIYYGRGALDYRLKMWEIYAGFPRAQVYDAPLGGVVRQWAGMWLNNGEPWRNFPKYDVLVYTGIPHNAIGAENSYALPAYVQAGGGVLFTGGEYAFGKGGYMFTVLERELLPVLCTETVDTRYSGDTPYTIEPGKDFAELGVKTDFATKPAFYCYNQVLLKDDPRVKVFLKSGNRPILVGWQLGKGRVACLLVDHRGLSGDGVTMYYDWKGWEPLMRGVLAWLAPEAGKTDVQTPMPKAEVAQLLQTLAQDSATDVSVAASSQVDDPGAVDMGILGHLNDPGIVLDEKSLKKRVALLQQLLPIDTPEVRLALAGQVAKIGNLPDDLREEILAALRWALLPAMAEVAAPILESAVPSCRANALQVLALSGSAKFAAAAKAPAPNAPTDPYGYGRALGRAVAGYTGNDLVTYAKQKVDGWNAEEAKTKARYVGTTGGTDFSLAAPEQPCIDSEALYQRVGWLAYLSRKEPATYGAQFAREWLKVGQYAAWCEMLGNGVWQDKTSTEAQKRARHQEFMTARSHFLWLGRATEPAIEELLAKQPDLLAQGFAQGHFMAEVERARNFLARYPVAETRGVLTTLAQQGHRDLAAFAKARLAAGP